MTESEDKQRGSHHNPLPSRKFPLDFMVLFYARSGWTGKDINGRADDNAFWNHFWQAKLLQLTLPPVRSDIGSKASLSPTE
jgi:hypothetical protein